LEEEAEAVTGMIFPGDAETLAEDRQAEDLAVLAAEVSVEAAPEAHGKLANIK
jgi:hypothetical protein